MMRVWHLISIVGSSLTASIGIMVPDAWMLAPCGLMLFLYLLRASEGSATSSIWSGFLFGTITGGASTIWFWDTLPLDFLGIQSPTVQRVSIGMTWLYVSLSLGAPIALVAFFIRASRALLFYPLVVAILWSLGERCRMWSFALTTWAPESLLGAHFSAASIGYPLTENHLLRQLAFPFGVDGLNFIAAFSAALLVEAVQHRYSLRQFRRCAAQLALVTLCVSASQRGRESLPSRPGTDTIRFAILANNHMDVRDTSTHTFLQEQLAEVALSSPPVDVILLPEEFSLTSIFWSKKESDEFIKKHFGDRDVLILHTRNDSFPAEETNNSPEPKKLVYESTRSGELGRYIKQNLMPLGEYSPAFTSTFFSLINDPELHLYIDGVHELTNPVSSLLSTGSMPAVSFKGVRIGGLLCSDLLSPALYRTLARQQGAEVLINLANQFWFHNSRTLYWKTIQMARVHAVQNRSPLILANNAAPSFALDRNGDFIVESTWEATTLLYVSLETMPTDVAYSRPRILNSLHGKDLIQHKISKSFQFAIARK